MKSPLKSLLKLATFSLVVSATSVFAADPSTVVVNKSTCGRVAHTTQPFILVLGSGDDLLESIAQCAKDAKLKGASINALGQLHNPTLAYFTSNPDDKPALTTFPGYYELASLSGNITNNDNVYYVHSHGVLADKKFHGIAGHINAAKVGLAVEVTVIPFSQTVQRAVDPKTGFGLIIQDQPAATPDSK